ncbi:hypothetical protein QAD02_006605 [Eretmocerus hayati]|uniref:Uncharacterized protein n=1 Tax=Eretmocerus hayati TaxID=131215 RepID=A0ACC2N1F5_9HYME|nr:hypothetical protein QAD02_006605 [Eretmocerus hayati]
MDYRCLFLLCYLIFVSASIQDDFVIEYFIYKNISSVVSFSCSLVSDEVVFMQRLNQAGIRSASSRIVASHSLKNIAHTEYWKLGIFFDLECFDSRNLTALLSEASDYRMFDELHSWLVLSTNIDRVRGVIDVKAFGLSTDFLIAVPSISTLGYELYDVYNIMKGRGTPLQVILAGFWSPKEHWNIGLHQPKSTRRADLQKIILRTAFFPSKFKPAEMSEENYFVDHSTAPRDGLSKYGFAILTQLSQVLNFTLKVYTTPFWEEGDHLGPIMQAMLNNDSDLTGSPPTMNIKRTYIVKFLHQSWPIRSCFFFRSPQKSSIRVNEVLGPFEISVWYSNMFLFIVSVWVMSSVLRYESCESRIVQCSNSFLMTIGALCQQGSNERIHLISSRMAFICIMIYSFLIYNFYSAIIVSTRLNEPISMINDSLTAMARENFKYASHWMPYFELFIKAPDAEIVAFNNKVWSHIPKSERFLEPSQGLSLVQQGGFAYHMHPYDGYPFIARNFGDREICELTEVHLKKEVRTAFGVNRNTSLEEIMKIGLMKISEVGLQKRELLRWSSQKPQCSKNTLSATALDIYEFAPHLFVLLIGMILAFAVFIIEILKHHEEFRITRAWKFLNYQSSELLQAPDPKIMAFNDRVWSHTLESQRFKEPSLVLSLVQEGSFAYHMHQYDGFPSIARDIGNREMCELTEVHLRRIVRTAFGLNRNISFGQVMKIGSVIFQENYVHGDNSRRPESFKSTMSATALDLYEFAPHLFVLNFGVSLASAVSIVEILRNR